MSRNVSSIPELSTDGEFLLPGRDEMFPGHGPRMVIVHGPVAEYSLLRALPRTESHHIPALSPEQTEHCENGESISKRKPDTSVAGIGCRYE